MPACSPRTNRALPKRFRTTTLAIILALTTAGQARGQDAPAEPAASQAPDVVAPADPAQWIVDYALTYGQRVTAPSTEDAEYVLVWLDAATRISPGLASAHLWRYDLLHRLGRDDAARAAFADYCRAAPHDVHAAIQRLDMEMAAARTAEERIALCTDRLTDPEIPAELASDIHRRLAEMNFARGDVDAALADARRAAELVPLNLAAQRLLATIEERAGEPRTQVELLVSELSVNPGSLEARQRLADTLAALGMSQDAVKWYDLAQRAFLRQFPERTRPAEMALAEAAARAEAGDVEGAAGLCRSLLAADPANVPAALALIALAHDAERPELAGDLPDVLGRRLHELAPQAAEKQDAVVCAQLAAYHLDVAYDPHRALEFARKAAEAAPDAPAVRALLGRALLEAGQPQEAIDVLGAVARSNQRAAVALATALRSQQRDAEAVEVLHAAATLRCAGRDFRRIRAVLRELHADLPACPDAAPIRALLDRLSPALLDFPANPADSIRYEVALQPATVPLSAPIRAEVALVNKADFTVSLGSGRMASDEIAVSVRNAADPASERVGYLTIGLNEAYLLAPGERTTRLVELDTVSAQALLYRQPQRDLELEFTFTPAPLITTGDQLACSLPGITPLQRRCTRRAVNASPEGLNRLAAQLRTGGEAERLAAIDIMLALVVERTEVLSGKNQPYPMAHVDNDHLLRLLRVALRDRSPLVRARAACALSYTPLDDATIADLAPLLADAHFLPRMFACELFARQQGRVFLPVLTRLADDRDPQVAALARLYRAGLAGSPPAGEP